MVTLPLYISPFLQQFYYTISMTKKITSRKEDYSNWYIDIITRAQLADYSPVKGSMVIRPRGYAIWELLQQDLDKRFKETGHQNAYFPLLIPKNFITKEAEHIEGFSPELAVVTHAGGEQLEEPLVVRPTSETIIWSMYKKWIQSYRDLPILINQWANVVRWEKRTRLFLRTSEFLWQEGHTAHETSEEAVQEMHAILHIYKTFAEETLALPVIDGKKSDAEKFAGAIDTYAIESLMQDGRSLQAGTSHFLGQNFAKAFDVQYQTKTLDLDYVWATSWGVSTRLIGAVIMTHSDDDGLVLPPKVASQEAVIIPIYKEKTKGSVLNVANQLYNDLRQNFRMAIDNDDSTSPGWKFSEWELRGVPVRIEIGPKDIEKTQITMVRRDTREKFQIPLVEAKTQLRKLLDSMQKEMLQKARAFTKANTHTITTMKDFIDQIETSIPGYIIAPWDGTNESELAIKEKTKATIRIISEQKPSSDAVDIYSGLPATKMAIFAKAY